MQKLVFFLLVLLATLSCCERVFTQKEQQAIAEMNLKGSNFKCTICVVAVTIVQNEAGDHRQAIENVLEKVCNFVPPAYNATVLTCYYFLLQLL